MTRDAIIALVRACARKLGRNPTVRDLRRFPGFKEPFFYQRFRGMRELLQAAGLEPKGSGYKIATTSLLLDWAAAARKLKRLPTVVEYSRLGRFSPVPFGRRFGEWRQVPEAFRLFARQRGLEKPWADVLRMIGARALPAARALQPQSLTAGEPGCDPEMNGTVFVPEPAPQQAAGKPVSRRDVNPSIRARAGLLRRRLRSDRPVYGAPSSLPGLGHEPVNEAGVVFVFGALARELGFIVERMQKEFPDCEALFEAEPGKWQRLRIEFEYASRNFRNHGHRARDCDMIVCWVHDWADCPKELDVIELRRVVHGS